MVIQVVNIIAFSMIQRKVLIGIFVYILIVIQRHKFELLESYYPGKAHLMGLTEMWRGLDWEVRLEIYREVEIV